MIIIIETTTLIIRIIVIIIITKFNNKYHYLHITITIITLTRSQGNRVTGAIEMHFRNFIKITSLSSIRDICKHASMAEERQWCMYVCICICKGNGVRMVQSFKKFLDLVHDPDHLKYFTESRLN